MNIRLCNLLNLVSFPTDLLLSSIVFFPLRAFLPRREPFLIQTAGSLILLACMQHHHRVACIVPSQHDTEVSERRQTYIC